MIYLQLKLSVELQKEAGETLTHAVLLLLDCLIRIVSIALTVTDTF